MYDDRLQLLSRAGYSVAQLLAFGKILPENYILEIGSASSPRAARDILKRGLAETKASAEEFEEE